MIQSFFLYYVDSFKGLRKEVWLMALVTLINRTGTMVFPFMAIYMKKELGFSNDAVSMILLSFGAGSMLGAWLGGKLTDRIGFYDIMFWSLLISGIQFITLQFISNAFLLAGGLFLSLVVSDSFRPAAYVAINTYSRVENRTRSVTLFRLAINLGFAVGPALGGIFIRHIGYNMIFWIDGLTCIAAGFLFILLLNKKQSKRDEKQAKSSNKLSPYKDRIYWIFLLAMLLIGIAFFQFFSTIPLFLDEIHFMKEDQIGYLMMMVGLIVFVFEMPAIKKLESNNISIYKILIFSTLLFTGSFLILNAGILTVYVVLSFVLLSLGELINFPFLNRFALDRSLRGKQGDYMALFTMTFSSAHMIGSYGGVQLVDKFGYEITWYVFASCLLFSSFLFVLIRRFMKKENF